jgi:hypothetical protein
MAGEGRGDYGGAIASAASAVITSKGANDDLREQSKRFMAFAE